MGSSTDDQPEYVPKDRPYVSEMTRNAGEVNRAKVSWSNRTLREGVGSAEAEGGSGGTPAYRQWSAMHRRVMTTENPASDHSMGHTLEAVVTGRATRNPTPAHTVRATA